MTGIEEKKIVSPEFGKKPVKVFAIALKSEPDSDISTAVQNWKESLPLIPDPLRSPRLTPPSQDFVQLGAFQTRGE